MKQFAASLDGQMLVCAAVASACFVLGGTTWAIHQISPGSPDLSGLIVPGVLYSLMGVARVPAILRSQKTALPVEESSQPDREDSVDTSQNIVAGRIDPIQSDANAA